MKRFTRLDILNERLRMYYEAERSILQGQSYSMEGLTLTRANLDTVRKAIADLESEIIRTQNRLNSSRSRVRVVIPVDCMRMYRGKTLCR